MEFKIFIFLNFATFIVFILLGLLSFSPTRHLIFYLPSVAIVISLCLGHAFVRNTFNINTLLIFIILVFSITFFSAKQIQSRKSPYDEKFFLNILRKNNIEKIIINDSCASPIYFSKEIKENFEVISSKHGSCHKKINIGKNLYYGLKKNIIIINFENKINKNILLEDNKELSKYNLILEGSLDTKFKSELYQNIDAYKDGVHYLIYKYKN